MSITQDYLTRIKEIELSTASKKDFIRFFVYKRGTVRFSNVTFQELVKNLIEEKIAGINTGSNLSTVKSVLKVLGYIFEEVFDEDAFKKAREKNRKSRYEAENEFKNALFEYNDVSGQNAEKLYALCSSRTELSDIEDMFADFADLIR